MVWVPIWVVLSALAVVNVAIVDDEPDELTALQVGAHRTAKKAAAAAAAEDEVLLELKSGADLDLEDDGTLPDLHLFKRFLKVFKRTYHADSVVVNNNNVDWTEFAKRLRIFSVNRRTAWARNAEEAALNPHPNRATHGITKYADWTPAEFNALLGFDSTPTLNSGDDHRRRRRRRRGDQRRRRRRGGPQPHDHKSTSAPCTKIWGDSMDVRDQGKCGDCWAFSTVEALRQKHIADTGHDVGKLSTQFLVNCMKQRVCKNGTVRNGCCGGMPSQALRWIQEQGGIPTQKAYGDVYTAFPALLQTQANESASGGPVAPNNHHGITFSGYYPGTDWPCKNNTPKAVTVTGDVVKAQSEEEMGSYVCSTGAYSIAVDASRWSTYTGGVMHAATCGTSLDHAVLLKGIDKEQNAWVVQNSWGADWGATVDGKALPWDQSHKCRDLIAANPKLCDAAKYVTWCAKSCAKDLPSGGYVLLQYGNNTCGVAQEAVYPSGTEKV